jgi:hypothetical protein
LTIVPLRDDDLAYHMWRLVDGSETLLQLRADKYPRCGR